MARRDLHAQDPMTLPERLDYIRHAFDVDFGRLGTVVFLTEETWESEILNRPHIDHLKYHKDYGMFGPQMVRGRWTLAVCPERMTRYVSLRDRTDFKDWVTYWVLHALYHVIVTDETREHLDSEQLEKSVDARMAFEVDRFIGRVEQFKQVKL